MFKRGMLARFRALMSPNHPWISIMKDVRFVLAVAACFFLLFMTGATAAEETCCDREVATMPIAMPKPEERDCTSMLNKAINGVLTRNFARMDDCPVIVETMDFKGVSDLNKMTDKIAEIAGAKNSKSPSVPELVDYQFRSTLSLVSIDEVVKGEWEEGYEGRPNWEPGYVNGTWKLKVDLVDSARGTVVRSGSTGWRGNCSGDASAAVTNLVKTRFMPLDDIIYDYERIPDTAKVVPEAPRIEAGTEATVSVTEIKDQKGRQSAPFERLLVTVDKGRVVNGFEKGPYKVFEVGPAGTVQVRYRAPDQCRDQTANLQVFNSCNINDGLFSTVTEKPLTTAEIHIHCTPKWQWRGTLSLNRKLEYHCSRTWPEGRTGREIQARDLNSATGAISLVTDEGDDPPGVLTESDMKMEGTILLLRDEFDEQWWREPTALCWNGQRNAVVTPGPWTHKTNSQILQRTCPLVDTSVLSLSFIDLTAAEAAELVKKIEAGGWAAGIAALPSGQEAPSTGSEYIRVLVQLGLECRQPVKIERHDYRYDRCEGTTKDEPGSGSSFMTLPTFFYNGQLEGTIRRTKDGEVILEAAAEGAKIVPDGYTEFTLWGCPSRVMVTDTTRLVLRRRRVR
jgi:hypothetical protein